MTTPSSHHEQFLEQLPAYVAGGLEAPEREALEAHLAGCGACAAALRDIAELDRSLERLFASARPGVDFEEELVKNLRNVRRRLVHPSVWRAATGLAAALLLGSVGYAGNYLMQRNLLPGMPHIALLGERRESKAAMGGEKAKGTEIAGGMRALYGMAASPEAEARKANEAVRAKLVEERQPAETRRFDASHPRQYADFYDESLSGSATNAPMAAGQAGLPGLRLTEADKRVSGLSSGGAGSARVGEELVTLRVEQRKGEVQNGDVVLGVPLDVSGVVEGKFAGDVTAGVAVTQGQAGGGLGGGGFGGGFGGYGGFSAGRGVSAVGSGPAPGGAPEAMYFKVDGLNGSLSAVRGEAIAGEAIVGEVQKSLGKGIKGQSGTDASERVLGRSSLAKVAASDGPAPAAAEPTRAPAVSPAPQPPAEVQAQQANRKIIRNGEMQFEVDSFDSSFVQISRIVVEEGGFVASSSSEKMENGKVRGTVSVRVPPDRLDTLVLKLRALGDLKSQRISAQDVTKVYYDLEGELKAARAMEERLLNIIKSGKGEIKDLLEAEKQLGVYREKIEKLEGEIRYYNNLVSLSTLSITLTEKDIKAAAFAAQTELVSMGIETEDVEKARADALKAVEEAKGRVIESNLKKHDAGQLAATLVCEVSPESSGPLIDRLKQLGRVARLDIDRKQTTPPGTAAPPQNVRVERRDTRFAISIYNLANIAPRQTNNMSLAVEDVEESYRSILKLVEDRKGRIVTSTLNRQKPEQTTATINFEVPSGDAESVLTELRRDRQAMSFTVTENPDTNNVTAAKRGFVVQVFSLANVAPRQSEQLVLATKSAAVTDAFNRILDEMNKLGVRILASQINEQDKNNVQGLLEIELMREKEFDTRAALAANGVQISRNVSRSSDAQNTIDSKLRLRVQVIGLGRLAPRETQSLGLAAGDVPASYQALLATLNEEGARILKSQLDEQNKQNITGVLDFEILSEKRDRINKAIGELGQVYSRTVTRSNDTQNTVDIKVRMQVSVVGVEQLPPRQKSRLMVEVAEVEQRTSELREAAIQAGGRVTGPQESIDSSGQMSSHMVIDVPLEKAAGLRDQVRSMGTVRVRESSEDPQAPLGPAARAQLDVTLANAKLLVGSDQGLGAAIRNALAMSLRGLLWSLQLILIGVLILGPWALLLWGGWRLWRRPRVVPVTVQTPPAPGV